MQKRSRGKNNNVTARPLFLHNERHERLKHNAILKVLIRFSFFSLIMLYGAILPTVFKPFSDGEEDQPETTNRINAIRVLKVLHAENSENYNHW